MATGLAWLRATWRSMTVSPDEGTGRRPMSIGIGFCPGCRRLRASNSLGCSYCGSTAAVAEDA